MAKTKNEANTVYLDLDAVQPEVSVVVKLDKKEHKMVPISVEDFIKNTKLIQQIQATDENDIEATEQNFRAIVSVLAAQFPTIGAERLGKLTFPQLRAMQFNAMENSGATGVQSEMEKEANPQTAG